MGPVGRSYSITRPSSGKLGDHIAYVQGITRHTIDDDGTLRLFSGEAEVVSYPRGEWEVVSYA